ncbi:unnamed protein product [Sphenostylis stenocarpa]|uniref:Uncharacterized protein n=1 Tax=Sphenostylis stenocarpa TaxID=92480 RepID=A0AA86SUA4_9FABA|nr:unnamed protein product [Sphenostylis stenocarpa]
MREHMADTTFTYLAPSTVHLPPSLFPLTFITSCSLGTTPHNLTTQKQKATPRATFSLAPTSPCCPTAILPPCHKESKRYATCHSGNVTMTTNAIPLSMTMSSMWALTFHVISV